MDRVVAGGGLEGQAQTLPLLHDLLSQRARSRRVGVGGTDDVSAERLPGELLLVELHLHPANLRARGCELLPHAPVEPVDNHGAVLSDEGDVVARSKLEGLPAPPPALDRVDVERRILLLVLREIHDGAIRRRLGPAFAELLLEVRLPVARDEQLAGMELDSVSCQSSIVIVDDPLGLDDVSSELALRQDADALPFQVRPEVGESGPPSSSQGLSPGQSQDLVVDSMRLHKDEGHVHRRHEMHSEQRPSPRPGSSRRACNVEVLAGRVNGGA
eukprot:751764-Hanusia_phi.AAC.5